MTKNALKFTLKGEIRIRAAYNWQQEKLIVHVVDTGVGINNCEMDKLFTMFGKIDRTEDMNSEGVGIGLVI